MINPTEKWKYPIAIPGSGLRTPRPEMELRKADEVWLIDRGYAVDASTTAITEDEVNLDAGGTEELGNDSESGVEDAIAIKKKRKNALHNG